VAEPSFSIWRRLGFTLGGVSLDTAGTPADMLLLFYLTEVAGLRAGLAGLVLALPKVWDALIDPMLGGWTDRVAMRLGTRTPIALVAGAAYVVPAVLVFCLHRLHTPWQIATAGVLLLALASSAMTIFGVSNLSLATEMTSGSAELTGLLSLSGVVGTLFGIAGTAMAPLLVSWAGGGHSAYATMAVEFGLAAALFMLVYVLATRRVPVRKHPPGSEATPLWTSIRATAANHSFYFLLAYLICQGTGGGILGAFLPFANRYVLLGDLKSLSVLGVISAVAVLAGLPLAPPLVKRLGAMRAVHVANLACLLAYGLLFAASFGPIWLSWAVVAALGVAGGAMGVVLQATLLDLTRLKLKGAAIVPLGIYLGILMTGVKLGASAGGFAAGELLDLIGFVSGGGHQSAATLMWLRVGYTLVPLAFFAGGSLFLRHINVPPAEEAGRAPADTALSPPQEALS